MNLRFARPLLQVAMITIGVSFLANAQEPKNKEATAAPQYGIAAVRLMMERPDLGALTNHRILRVSMPYSISTADAAVSNLTITFPKTHRRIPTGNVTLQPIIAAFGATELEYELTIDPATTPSPEDNKIDVAFD